MKKFTFILFYFLTVGFVANSNNNTNEILGSDPKIKFVQCYPNPATTNINFNINVVDKGYTISVYNFIGKKIEEIKITSQSNNISLDNYFRGIYIYQLRNKQGQIIECGKFQVAK